MINNQKIVLFDIDYTVFDTDLLKKSQLKDFAVYSEVIDTLTNLSKIATLGVFSEGVIDFQRKKLRKTHIEKFFFEKHIHLVENKSDVIEKMLRDYRDKGKLYLVDDKITILAKAKECYPQVFTIWVKRGIYANVHYADLGFTPDASVDNLRQIIPIISTG
jgi:FMN phosphatase YigB (HAD superfamily)